MMRNKSISCKKIFTLKVALLLLFIYSNCIIWGLHLPNRNNQNDGLKSQDYVVAYEEPKFKGASLKLFPSSSRGCSRLPDNWQNRILSVDVIGGCVDLCQDTECEGPCRRMCPGIRGENNLTLVNLDNTISSFSRCTCPYQRLQDSLNH